jgi:penicillin-binding protein 2
MKNVRPLNLILALVFLAACGKTASPTALPTPPVGVTHAPSPEAAMQAYLNAFLVEDYASMYATLTQASRDTLSQDDFTKTYTDSLNFMSVQSIETSLLSSLINPQNAQVAFRVTYHTALFGDLQGDINTNLILEGGSWHIQWDSGLILPQLAGGRHLVINRTPPARGNLYDRNGTVIAGERDAYAIGLRSGAVSDETAGALYNRLWQLTGTRPEVIRDLYNSYGTPDQYIPIGEASAEAVDISGIGGFSSVILNSYTSRFYEPNVGPNVTGYVQAIFETELKDYLRLGYNPDEMVGKAGVEKWGEEYLHGRDGATLYVATSDGTLESVLAQADTQPADSIYLTIDSDLQRQAQAAMDGYPGAIVVMELDTGRVLAMVSSPGFDPNWYEPDNFNQIRTDPPETFNRATQGQYPLGSVFKIITMAAALESGDFTVDSTWDCQYEYTELVPFGGPTLHDWTWQHCQDEMAANGTDTCAGANSQPSGLLTLPQGLMRSCDPWFYHIGFTLYQNNKASLISDMARGFGLGQATGIGQVAETDGFIPAAATDGTDATSIAIGQGNAAPGGSLHRRGRQRRHALPPAAGREDPAGRWRPAQRLRPGDHQHPAGHARAPAGHPGRHAQRGDEHSRHGLRPPEHPQHPGGGQDGHGRERCHRPARLVRRLQPGRQARQARHRRGGGRQQPGRRGHLCGAHFPAHHGNLLLRPAQRHLPLGARLRRRQPGLRPACRHSHPGTLGPPNLGAPSRIRPYYQ